MTYELVIRNVGSADLTDLTLADDLHSGLGQAFASIVSMPVLTQLDGVFGSDS